MGSQYRSAIFYADDTQKSIAENMVKSLQKQGINVVTQIRPSETFYPAESYHQTFLLKIRLKVIVILSFRQNLPNYASILGSI